jgi:hypothetical protein
MDDFFSLYLAVNICKAFDYGFGSKTRRPGRPKSATFHETAPLRFLYLLSIFTIISMTITNEIRGTQVMFSSKVDEEDLHGSGSSLSSSVYDSQEIQKSAG